MSENSAILPLYSIHGYREDFYKVVAWKRSPNAWLFSPKEHEHYEEKLRSSFSRARSMVLQYGLCNEWDYFFTGTLDEQKFGSRFDVERYHKRFMQWIRDQRKAYGCKFDVLLVPEHHKDGAWHVHGFVHGLPQSAIGDFPENAPRHLREEGFVNWPDYMAKFGWCSLAPIKDPIACAFYVSKYISKELSDRAGETGSHLYWASRPLKRAQHMSDVYVPTPALDRCCDREYDFCKTGFVNADWTFPYDFDGVDIVDESPMFPVVRDPLEDFDPRTVDPFYEQTSLFSS